jgi:hypothetical protein
MEGYANTLDALHMEIGRIAHHHVLLDAALRGVYVALATPSAAVYLVNDTWSTAALVRACKTMIERSPAPPQVVEAGVSALEAADKANTERNRVVHDMWLPDVEGTMPTTPVRWNLTKIERGSFGRKMDGVHDLRSLNDARFQIFRAHIRVSALQWALCESLPSWQGSGIESGPRIDWVAVMEGRFVLDEDGSFRIDDHDDGSR